MISQKDYFETIALTHRKGRLNNYYWKGIIDYLRYFSHPYARVLEIGCGTGDLLAGIEGSTKVGIDFSHNAINQAEEKHGHQGIRFLKMDATTEMPEGQFDLIILSNLIGYVDDIQSLFSKLHSCCHARTKVIVQFYNPYWEPIIRFAEWVGMKKKTPDQNWMSLKDIQNLLYLSGFEVYRHSRRMLLPLYIPLISTIFNRYLANLPLIRLLCVNNYSFARVLPRNINPAEKAAHSVSVIIPARNESGHLHQLLARLPQFGKELEIIFVEGHSTDDTWEKILEITKQPGLTSKIVALRQKGKGKADAVREGFAHATGDILMILDADITVPPEDLPKFYEALASGKGDFINGTRLVYPMAQGAMRFLNYLGNHLFSFLFSWLLDQRFNDTLCGTKALFRDDYLKLKANSAYFGDFDPFGDFELIFGAHKLNLKILEVPVKYAERTYGTTNISRFRHGWILLTMVIFALRKCKFI